MFGLDCRLDRVQGRRTVFVFGNPIIKTLCATVGFSDVTSANTVGYVNQTIAKGEFACIAVQFEDVGSATDTISIGEFIKGDFAPGTYSDFDEWQSKAPGIQVWDGTGYSYYYYLDAHSWWGAIDVPKGWCDRDGLAADGSTLSVGQAVWFKNPLADTALTTPGQVAVITEQGFTCNVGEFYMLANYLPIPLDLRVPGKMVLDGVPMGTYDDFADWQSAAPGIQVWDGTGYSYMYYLSAHSWWGAIDVPAGWCDRDGLELTDTNIIPAGRGFWIKVSKVDEGTSYTVTFKK